MKMGGEVDMAEVVASSRGACVPRLRRFVGKAAASHDDDATTVTCPRRVWRLPLNSIASRYMFCGWVDTNNATR